MNPMLQLKELHLPFFGMCVLACSAIPATAEAVTPPPDGGYPGGNTAEGQNALFSVTTGGYNTAVGFFSLRSNMTGSFNTAVGAGTLMLNAADNNTATSAGALLSTTTGGVNTANGAFALFNNITGHRNNATGSNAPFTNTDGTSNNANFGSAGGARVTAASNVICIGAGDAGFNVDDSCFIGNIRDALVAPDAVSVFVDSAGKLGTTSGSSRLFKEEIKPMDKASEAILALKPVTFHYKSDKTETPQFGLIAESRSPN